MIYLLLGSSRPEVFCKKGVIENFAKFTGKHLCQSLFFNKVAGFRPATLLKERLRHRCFPVNFVKFLRTPFFIEHLCWLLLTLDHNVIKAGRHLFINKLTSKELRSILFLKNIKKLFSAKYFAKLFNYFRAIMLEWSAICIYI